MASALKVLAIVPLVLGIACAHATRSSARSIASDPIDTAYVAAQVARWDSLAVTIPAIIPNDANWLNAPERWAATLRCPRGHDSWAAPDVVIVQFAAGVDLDRRRTILDQVRGRVVASPSGFFYLVWLRPTGHCDAGKVAAELQKIEGVQLALPQWFEVFGEGSAPARSGKSTPPSV